MVVDDLHLRDPFSHRVCIAFQALIEKQIVAEGHVMRRNRCAIRKAGFGTHIEDDPGLAFWIFQTLRQETVEFPIDIGGQANLARRLAQEAFISEDRKQMRAPLARVRVHRIEGTHERDGNLTALGRVRIDIVEMLVIRGIGQIAKERIAVADDHLFVVFRPHEAGGQHHDHYHRPHGPPEGATGSCLGDNARARLGHGVLLVRGQAVLFRAM